MKKVGEHITLDFLGVKQDYPPNFYNKVIYNVYPEAATVTPFNTDAVPEVLPACV